ncbi:MAG TPA: HAMP domain-containing sensor histidine kinase, partial [Thermoanaerobaculia bacterium]|nr:HAMP domain-containing sensor histidine kinase [Thermoanaerobaculia bacterium]
PHSIAGRVRCLARRRSLWAALFAVVLPLAILLALQYRSLVHLEHLSAIAHRAALDNYLEAVVSEVQHFYESSAERTLNLPVSVFTESHWDEAGWHFKKKGVAGARLLFLVSFVEGEWERLVFFDREGRRLGLDPYSREYRAIWVTATSWSVLGRKGIPVGPVSLAIDERDPEHRIVLNPVTEPIDGETARIVGVAGMVVDAEHLERELLPAAIDRALPAFFREDSRARPTVTVRNGAGELVYAAGPLTAGGAAALGPEDATRSLPFVFTDWSVGILASAATAEKVARENFHLNMGLSALIALVLLAGVVLALRTAARAVRLSEMKSDFVSNVSHELRTPVASIRAFGELLALGRADGDKAREYGERIEAESRRLTALINNILDFSRLESGQKPLHLERADAGELAAAAVASFRGRLEQQGFGWRLLRPAGPLPVRADPAALGQVLSNLLDNAVKYSDAGREITVTADLGTGSPKGVPAAGGRWVTIAVRDRGIGIAREEQGRIFERFHRVSSSLVHDVKGSGLGLALVDAIVRAHGGRVTVESEPGLGSTFTVWLPADLETGPAAEPAAGGDKLRPYTTLGLRDEGPR